MCNQNRRTTINRILALCLMVLNSRHNFAKITKTVDHATLVHTASLLTVMRTMICTVAGLYENLSGPSELRTLNQNLSSSQFQSPAPSPSPAMRRAESDLCSMWLQTGACSAAMRGLCTRAHSLNELSSHRPSPHTSYFNVSGLEILVDHITTYHFRRRLLNTIPTGWGEWDRSARGSLRLWRARLQM